MQQSTFNPSSTRPSPYCTEHLGSGVMSSQDLSNQTYSGRTTLPFLLTPAQFKQNPFSNASKDNFPVVHDESQKKLPCTLAEALRNRLTTPSEVQLRPSIIPDDQTDINTNSSQLLMNEEKPLQPLLSNSQEGFLSDLLSMDDLLVEGNVSVFDRGIGGIFNDATFGGVNNVSYLDPLNYDSTTDSSSSNDASRTVSYHTSSPSSSPTSSISSTDPDTSESSTPTRIQDLEVHAQTPSKKTNRKRSISEVEEPEESLFKSQKTKDESKAAKEQKKDVRREKNRQSAQKSRNQKKQLIETLTQENKVLKKFQQDTAYFMSSLKNLIAIYQMSFPDSRLVTQDSTLSNPTEIHRALEKIVMETIQLSKEQSRQ